MYRGNKANNYIEMVNDHYELTFVLVPWMGVSSLKDGISVDKPYKQKKISKYRAYTPILWYCL